MANETAYEVLQLAITMEEEGQKFYGYYSEQAKGKTKDILLKLASDEVEHANFFKNLYNNLENTDDDYLFDETVVNTFRSYANSAAFNRDEISLDSMADVIAEGIKTEKYTIDFYEKLSERSGEDNKKVIKQIIAEEKRHVEDLESLLG